MTPEKQRALADVLALIRARHLHDLTADEKRLALDAAESRAALDEARRERDEVRGDMERLREAAELVHQRMKRDGEILCGTRHGSAADILGHVRACVVLDEALRALASETGS